jgi:ribosome-associated toxin RatA of RatAB toxin-antitoxin module
LRPVTVTTTVPQSPEEVFDVIDDLAAHEEFTDHFLVDWTTSGPATGVGGRARMRVKKPGKADWMDLEVTQSERPLKTVEESIGAGGKRHTRGTYVLQPAGDGTRISFTLEWLAAPLSERLGAPLVRAVTKRSNAESLRRLAQKLAAAKPER